MEKLFIGNGVTMLTPAEQKEIVGGLAAYSCGGNWNLPCMTNADCPGDCICNSVIYYCVEYRKE